MAKRRQPVRAAVGYDSGEYAKVQGRPRQNAAPQPDEAPLRRRRGSDGRVRPERGTALLRRGRKHTNSR